MSSPQRRTTAATSALGILGFALAACGPAGPPPLTYVLGTPAPGAQSVEPLTGRPVIEVKPVLVPDYLDVSDILVRQAANVVAPSPTGRWGERLSVGVTRALAAALKRRLSGYIVTITTPVERPVRQVLAEIETFEPRPDGAIVLVARWRALDGAGRETLGGERVSLTEPIAGPGDAAVVAAMTQAIDDFAGRIAAGLRRVTPGPRAGR
jgi:uncharacterized lipoprotein YmbA